MDDDEKASFTYSPNRVAEWSNALMNILGMEGEIFLYDGKFAVVRTTNHIFDDMLVEKTLITKLTRSRLVALLRKKYDFYADDQPNIKIPPPPAIVDAILSQEFQEFVLPITGISHTPIILENGSYWIGGYHEKSGLYVSGYGSENRTWELQGSAEEIKSDALGSIRETFRNVAFVSEHDFSVFVAALMTALVCQQLDTKPAFAINALEPGCGKSTLVSAITVLAFGDPLTPIFKPKSEAQFNRQIEDALHGHPGAISVDNIDIPLSGARLCSMLSESRIRIRSAHGPGTSEVRSALFFLNGNNLQIVGPDLGRRVLRINLRKRLGASAGDELGSDWISRLLKSRLWLVPEMMGLLCAYIRAGRPPQAIPLPSFERWSTLVRDAVLWAGLPDPAAPLRVEMFDGGAAGEPDLQQLYALTGGAAFTAAGLALRVSDGRVSEQDLRTMIAASAHPLTSTRIGRALHALSSKSTGRFSVRRVGGHAGSNRWRVETGSMN